MVDRDIDVVGLACPFPLISVAKEVRAMRKGQVLRIIGNDPMFESTILEFCHEGGHEVRECLRDGNKVAIIFMI
jgi:TusA-related sulfurtransferase